MWPVSRVKFVPAKLNLLRKQVILTGGSPPQGDCKKCNKNGRDRGNRVVIGIDECPDAPDRSLESGTVALELLGVGLIGTLLVAASLKRRRKRYNSRD